MRPGQSLIGISRLTCAGVILLATGGATAAATEPVDSTARIDALVAEAIASRAMPGASVAIVDEDGGIVSRHYGSASLDGGSEVTGATRFRIGSISKLITALAIMKLAEDGRLRLDAPVAPFVRRLPGIERLPASVTVRHLLNHTSGLADFTRDELEAMVGRGVATDADLVRVLARPPASEPGRDWAYADAPFRILSHVVEHASGLTYERYVAERLAPALGLESLRACAPDAPDQARGYVSRNADLRPEPAYGIRGLLGEGGLCATAEDLARLPLALKSGKWIEAASLARMLAPTRLRSGEQIDYGFGVRLGLLGRSGVWGHTGGGLDGSWAALAHYPERGLTVAVTANGTGADQDAATLQAAIAAVLLGEAPPARMTPRPGLFRRLTGAYERRGRIACVIVLDGGLARTIRGTAAAPVSLLYQGSATFARADYPFDRILFQIEEGKAVGFRVHYDGFFAEYWRRTRRQECGTPAVGR